jgi:hypothetical protein
MKKLLIIMASIALVIFITDAILFNTVGNHEVKQKVIKQQTTYVDGKDTALSIGNGKFDIGKYAELYAVCEHIGEYGLETLLSYVQKYKQIGNKVYIISEEGYAIIDDSKNTGKLLITVKQQRCHSSIQDTVFASDLEGVTILKSYREFTKEERNVFEKLKKNEWWYGHTFHYTHYSWDN